MKNLKNLKGAKELSKNEQKTLKGGIAKAYSCRNISCITLKKCVDGECVWREYNHI